MASDITVVVDRRGRTTPLGDFVFRLLEQSGKSVSQLSRDANLSRSFLYLLKDDRQVPSLDSLVTLFEAVGVDEVRIADSNEPGELALVIDGRQWWVRLPSSSRRAARSRSALQTLSSPSPSMSAMPYDDVAGAPVLMSAAPASYSRDSGFTRKNRTDDRQRLLGELLAAAGALDKQRLELLVENAKLLGSS
jgi:transcriptional regulator with XRE-family HTH domain